MITALTLKILGDNIKNGIPFMLILLPVCLAISVDVCISKIFFMVAF